jgi:hypothetical protein
MFARLLQAVHGPSVEFQQLPSRPGVAFRVRARDGSTEAVVFDFLDATSHSVTWDPHTLHEAIRPLLDEVRAVLAEAGPEVLVFVTSDHGHVLEERGAPVWVDGASDIGYRAAYVERRLEGGAAARVFQIPASQLGHARPGWYVFPRPGHALRNAADRERAFRPRDSYRHGGLSLFEVVVPIACLRHRAARTAVRLAPRLARPARVGEPALIEVSVTADGLIASPVLLCADHPGVEAAVVERITTTPATASLRLLPSAPGRQTVRISARLGSEMVAEAALEIDVSAAPLELDVARAKLARLFGGA